jgi:hypothetical protein
VFQYSILSVTKDEWPKHITEAVEEYQTEAPSTICEFSETSEREEATQVRSRRKERLSSLSVQNEERAKLSESLCWRRD